MQRQVVPKEVPVSAPKPVAKDPKPAVPLPTPKQAAPKPAVPLPAPKQAAPKPAVPLPAPKPMAAKAPKPVVPVVPLPVANTPKPVVIVTCVPEAPHPDTPATASKTQNSAVPVSIPKSTAPQPPTSTEFAVPATTESSSMCPVLWLFWENLFILPKRI